MSIRRLAFIASAVGFLWGSHLEAATCESLTTLSLPNTTVTMAETVAAGARAEPVRLRHCRRSVASHSR